MPCNVSARRQNLHSDISGEKERKARQAFSRHGDKGSLKIMAESYKVCKIT